MCFFSFVYPFMNLNKNLQKSWVKTSLKERYLLNQKGSSKKTFHITLSAEGSEIQPGDSIAIFPKNDPILVEKILNKLQASGQEKLVEKRSGKTLSLYQIFSELVDLVKCSNRLLTQISPELKKDPLNSLDLQDYLEKLSCKIDLQAFVDALLPLMPRFYSIANSSSYHPEEIHLTVALASYEKCGEKRYGLASKFLCEDLDFGEALSSYIHPTKTFLLPEDLHANIIMIGPGTGIAPFRAFVQERVKKNAPGKNWLFFGERTKAFDFYYQDEWEKWLKKGQLDLTAVFSRDQEEKRYVQHALFDQKEEVLDWLKNGAYLYICGDAKNMAKDVLKTLEKVLQIHEALSEEEASLQIKAWKKEGKILLDVY